MHCVYVNITTTFHVKLTNYCMKRSALWKYISKMFPTVHAAIIAINEAIDQKVAADTMAALNNPSACLVNLDDDYMEEYQTLLFEAKETKAENAHNKVYSFKIRFFFIITLTC